MPEKLKRLVERCWAADYEERPDFDAIVEQLEEILNGLPEEKSTAGGDGPCCAIA